MRCGPMLTITAIKENTFSYDPLVTKAGRYSLQLVVQIWVQIGPAFHVVTG